MAQKCAPYVAYQTTLQVIRVESGGNVYAVHVNNLKGPQPPPPSSAQEAINLATRYIHSGYTVDLGLMQINSRNLSAVGITLPEAFDACTNIKAGATILTADYLRASRAMGKGLNALLAALSAYNTGDFDSGFANGYVARYYAQARQPIIGIHRLPSGAHRVVIHGHKGIRMAAATASE
ncbi:lytic transglycosylase domain-containing protein [Entomobacter blattae]|uniref:lytic transglycosylase domain-containing protein n=1 Tax=Entomobacter blattae TaxID=2762277 RepID=UPI00193B6E81|nr:lytic transglycosylase domain-containing protein [Entomobacter blattae]